MEVLTEQDVTSTAVDRWAKTYAFGRYQRKPNIPISWQKTVWDKLSALSNPSKDEIDAAIGNDSWTCVQCDECGHKVKAVAVFETSEFPLHLCHDCIVSSANTLVMELIE